MRALRVVFTLAAACLCGAAGDGADTTQIVERLRALQVRTQELRAALLERRLQETSFADTILLVGVTDNKTAVTTTMIETTITETVTMTTTVAAWCGTQEEWIPWGLCIIEYGLDQGLRPLLINWFTFIVSFVGCVTLNSAGYLYEPTWRHGGPWKNGFRALVVANFFFLGPIAQHPATYSLFFIIFCTALSDFVVRYPSVQELHRTWTHQQKGTFASQKQATAFGGAALQLPRLHGPADMCVGNKYEELSYPTSRVCVYFFVQVSLFGLYVYDMMIRKKAKLDSAEDIAKNVSFFRWLIAACLCYVAGETEAGQRYNPFFWEQVGDVACCDDGCFKDKTCNHWFAWTGVTFKWDWYLRRFLSFLINGVARSCIIGTAPIVVCTSDPLSTIKDCMAIFFITTVDDLPSAKSLIDELAYTYNQAFPKEMAGKKMKAQNDAEKEKVVAAAATNASDESERPLIGSE